MKNVIVLAACAGLSFIACTNNSTGTGTPGIVIISQDTSQVLSITSGTLTTSNTTTECVGNLLTQQTEIEVTNYEIVSGQLQTWQNGDCSRIIYTGNSTTLQGTWTTTFDTVSTNDPTCSDVDNIQEILPYLVNPTGTAVITDTTVAFSVNATLCMAQMLADQFDSASGGDISFSQLDVRGCNSLSYILGEDQGLSVPVTQSFRPTSANDIQVTTSIGNTCSNVDTLPGFGKEPTSCPQDNPFDSEELASCMFEYMFNESCIADFLLTQMMEDTTFPGTVTKINCTTLQMSFTQGPQTIDMTVEYEYAPPDGMNMTITSGICSTTGTISFSDTTGTDPFADPAFLQCISGGGPAPKLTSSYSLPNPLSALSRIKFGYKP